MSSPSMSATSSVDPQAIQGAAAPSVPPVIDPGTGEELPKPPNKMTRRILAGVLLGVVVYGVIVAIGGVDKFKLELQHFQWSAFGIACALASANYVLRFCKWEYYLAVLGIRGVPKLESFLIFLSGFVLTITPGKVGEVFKSYVLYERHGVPMIRTAPIVVAERLTDLIAIIAIITIGGSSFPGGLVWAALGAAVVGTILLLVTVPAFAAFILGIAPKVPVVGKVLAKAVPRIEQALANLRSLTKPARLIVPTLLSVVGWSFEGVAIYLILKGFGAEPVLLQTVFFYGTATLAGALIPVPGGLGVTEKVLEQSMVKLGGIALATSTAAMLLGRLATLWFAVLVGFLSLGILRLRPVRKIPSPETESPFLHSS